MFKKKRRKFSFSALEIRDIVLSLIVLAIVFSYPEFLLSPVFLLFSAVAIGIAFLGHELMHKFVAQHYGYWSEYRMLKQGLLLAVIFAIASGGRFIFAAPGAVVFSSKNFFKSYKKNDVGKIGVAGVVFNIIAVFVFLFLFAIFQNPLLRFAAVINSWLAIFNLIPFPPLDGSKVFQWSWKIWLGITVVSIISFLIVTLP